ncbi:MAG: hypothetical protein WD448_11770 [Woeseia sp.]
MDLRFAAACCSRIAAGLLVLVLSGAAQSQDLRTSQVARISLTPVGGYTFGGKFRDAGGAATAETQDSPHVGLILNIRESANTQWEVFYSRQKTEADLGHSSAGNAPVDLDLQYLQIGGTYVAHGGRARPFLAATVGVTRFGPDPLTFEADNFLSFGVGAGWQLQYSERLGLRLEARLLGTFLRSDTALFCRTGPEENVCAIAADSDMYWQARTSLGLEFRF